MTTIRNKALCTECKGVIESLYRHDFRRCECGAIAVDGGKAYLKRCGEINHFIELSEFSEENSDD